MNRYKVDAGIKNLEIQADFKISENQLKHISEVTGHILFDFNHVNTQSSAHSFNMSPVGSVNSASDEFFYFLKTNFTLAENILGFTPFSTPSQPFLGQGNLVSSLELFPEEKSYIKWKPMVFNTHLLRNAFLIDTIADYMHSISKKKDPSFSIQFGRLYKIKSKKRMKVDASYSESPEYITEIIGTNHSIIVSERHKEDTRQTSKFLSTDSHINPIESHLRVSDDMIYASVLHQLVKNLSMESEFREFSEKYESDLYILTSENKVIHFVSTP